MAWTIDGVCLHCGQHGCTMAHQIHVDPARIPAPFEPTGHLAPEDHERLAAEGLALRRAVERDARRMETPGAVWLAEKLGASVVGVSAADLRAMQETVAAGRRLVQWWDEAYCVSAADIVMQAAPHIARLRKAVGL